MRIKNLFTHRTDGFYELYFNNKLVKKSDKRIEILHNNGNCYVKIYEDNEYKLYIAGVTELRYIFSAADIYNVYGDIVIYKNDGLVRYMNLFSGIYVEYADGTVFNNLGAVVYDSTFNKCYLINDKLEKASHMYDAMYQLNAWHIQCYSKDNDIYYLIDRNGNEIFKSSHYILYKAPYYITEKDGNILIYEKLGDSFKFVYSLPNYFSVREVYDNLIYILDCKLEKAYLINILDNNKYEVIDRQILESTVTFICNDKNNRIKEIIVDKIDIKEYSKLYPTFLSMEIELNLTNYFKTRDYCLRQKIRKSELKKLKS